MKTRYFVYVVLFLGFLFAFLNYHLIVSSQFDNLALIVEKEKPTWKNTVVFLDPKFSNGANPLACLMIGLEWMRKNPEIYKVATLNGWKPEIAVERVFEKNNY